MTATSASRASFWSTRLHRPARVSVRSLVLNVPLECNQYINKLVAVVVVIIIIISIVIIIIIIIIIIISIIIIIITIITNIIIVIYGRISLPECRQPFSFEFFSSWRMNLSAPKFVTNVCYHIYHVIIYIMSSQISCHHKYHVIINIMSSQISCRHKYHVIIYIMSSQISCHHKYHVVTNIMSSQISCYHIYHVIMLSLSSGRSQGKCLQLIILLHNKLNKSKHFFAACPVANCAVCSSAGFCQKCMNGYYLDASATPPLCRGKSCMTLNE